MAVITTRRFDRLRAKNARDDFVSNKSVLGSDDGIAAFQVTGDHLGDGTANPVQKGTRDWLSGVSESNYCRIGTQPTDRCLRGYFLWVNIIDGKQPSPNWTNMLAIATYKTVG